MPGKAAQIVERRGKIPSKAVEVVRDNGATTGSIDPFSQALALASRHAIVG